MFSLTCPAFMQINWNKRSLLHKKSVQLPQDLFGTPKWPPFLCFGTTIGLFSFMGVKVFWNEQDAMGVCTSASWLWNIWWMRRNSINDIFLDPLPHKHPYFSPLSNRRLKGTGSRFSACSFIKMLFFCWDMLYRLCKQYDHVIMLSKNQSVNSPGSHLH